MGHHSHPFSHLPGIRDPHCDSLKLFPQAPATRLLVDESGIWIQFRSGRPAGISWPTGWRVLWFYDYRELLTVGRKQKPDGLIQLGVFLRDVGLTGEAVDRILATAGRLGYNVQTLRMDQSMTRRAGFLIIYNIRSRTNPTAQSSI